MKRDSVLFPVETQTLNLIEHTYHYALKIIIFIFNLRLKIEISQNPFLQCTIKVWREEV